MTTTTTRAADRAHLNNFAGQRRHEHARPAPVPFNNHNHKEYVMRIRFISWLAVGIAGAFLVVASTTFSRPDITALALGIGIGTLVVSLGIANRYRDSVPTLVFGLLAAVVSAWTIVASQVFAETTVQNLTLASSLAISGLAILGLGAHELSTERVVHSLEVGVGRRESELTAA